MTTRQRQPRVRRIAAENECFSCFEVLSAQRITLCKKKGNTPCCSRCEAAFIESEEIKANSERAYQKNRENRVAQQLKELEAFRAQRRQQRAIEQAAYEELCEERRSERQNEENAEWNNTMQLLAQLGGMR